MNKEKTIKQAVGLVKRASQRNPSTHDWWHIERVFNLAIKIGRTEKADLFLVKLIALLHDVDDWKFGQQRQKLAPWFLKKLHLDEITQKTIAKALAEISYRGFKNNVRPVLLEGQIVQDADRLDALGAIGIARCFAYGGRINRPIHDPTIKPQPQMDKKSHRQKTMGRGKSSSLNHFYEKGLLLKKLLNTKTAKKLAQPRYNYLVNYLKQFFKEWHNEN